MGESKRVWESFGAFGRFSEISSCFGAHIGELWESLIEFGRVLERSKRTGESFGALGRFSESLGEFWSALEM